MLASLPVDAAKGRSVESAADHGRGERCARSAARLSQPGSAMSRSGGTHGNSTVVLSIYQE
jgi:hypothetical protein